MQALQLRRLVDARTCPFCGDDQHRALTVESAGSYIPDRFALKCWACRATSQLPEGVLDTVMRRLHVVPEGSLGMHSVRGPRCWCGPVTDKRYSYGDYEVVVHFYEEVVH